MKASEVAARLSELAEAHGDPHVCALPPSSEYVQAVEPDTVRCEEMWPSSMIIIVGKPWAENESVKQILEQLPKTPSTISAAVHSCSWTDIEIKEICLKCGATRSCSKASAITSAQ